MPPRRRLPVSRAALAVIMLPIEMLREILRYLDNHTKLIIWDRRSVDWVLDHWTGTQRMQNRARLRRRVGQEQQWVLDSTLFSNLELSPIPTNILENMF